MLFKFENPQVKYPIIFAVFFLCFAINAYSSPLKEARRLLKTQNWSMAQKLIEEHLKKEPDSGNAYLLLGRVYERLGKKYENLSTDAYLLGAQKPQTEIRGKLLLGASYFRKKNYKLCASTFREVLIKMPINSKWRFSTLQLLGRALFEDGEFGESIKSLTWAKKIKKTPLNLYYLGLNHEKKNLYDQALEFYNELKEFPENKFTKKAAKREKAILRGEWGGKSSKMDASVLALTKLEVTEKKYPNAGAVILINDINTTVRPDKTSTTTVHKAVKILNDRGKKYGEISLDYDSSYQSVKIDFARTITKDGKVITVGEKSIRDLAPWAGYPLYSNARMLVVSMPEVMEGAIIEYKATWESSHLIGKENFQASHGVQVFEPKIKDIFKITIPSSLKLKVKYKNFPNSSPKTWVEGSNNIFLWETNDVKEIISEPAMPPWQDVTPMVFVSSFNSWEQIGKWFWKLAKNQFVENEAIKEKVSKLTKNKKNDYEKAAEIFHYVASKIRYVGIEYGESGYKPHNAVEIFENKYGDCKDQATLLVTMLKTAGIESQLVLIRTKDSGELFKKLPMVQFNHCIAMVVIDGKKIWMDPTYSTCSFGHLPWNDQDCYTLTMYKDNPVFGKTPLIGPEESSITKKINIELFPDKSLKVKFNMNTAGEYSSDYRGLKYTKPKKRKDYFRSMINSMYPGGKLIDYNVSDLDDLHKPVEITLKYEAPEGFKKAGPLGIFKMPTSKKGARGVALEERKYDILISGTATNISDVSVKIPEGYRIRFLPPEINYKDRFGEIKARYWQEGNVVFYHSESKNEKIKIKKEEYDLYKKRKEKIAKESDQPVIFEKENLMISKN